MMHNEVEVYVDDMIVKSKDRRSHTTNLRKFYKRIKEYRLRLNPQKCTFGVTARKLLGFLVSDKGIKVDPFKIKAILEMPPPKMRDEHLNPYQQYIENLTKTFDKIEYTIILRAQNQFADALATLASMVEIPEGVWIRLLQIKHSYEEVHKRKIEASIMTIEEEEVLWYYDIMKFLELGAYLDSADKRKHCSIRMMVS
ncbi:uncharacterized protein LOC126719673 [Quercus robur]|uniref:uncharacterized protein LOC126719673 n=1 Tax=Quercus robur TaxID=38942 RepID=UPI0021634FF8|nr:uncharacterized protein LOC126719673 [Quercus robur]